MEMDKSQNELVYNSEGGSVLIEKHRRKISSEEKVRILREHFIEKVPVSELCDKYGVQLQPVGRL
jgi:transposase-like protein